MAVQSARNAGIVVVVAAGNYGRYGYAATAGYGTIASPGNDPGVITVGSMKTNNHVVKPDLVAPGNQLDSVSCASCTMYTNLTANRTPMPAYSKMTGVSTNYFNLSGTSMATPLVSGAVALMFQKAQALGQTLTPDQVKARLMKTATKAFPTSTSVYDAATSTTYVSHYDLFTVGAGYMDAYAALNNTDAPSGFADSPIAFYDAASKTIQIKTVVNSLWGANNWATSVVWGETVVWGEAAQAGFSVVWGENCQWPQAAKGSFSTAESNNKKLVERQGSR